MSARSPKKKPAPNRIQAPRPPTGETSHPEKTGSLLQLQRTIGNQAVLRMIASEAALTLPGSTTTVQRNGDNDTLDAGVPAPAGVPEDPAVVIRRAAEGLVDIGGTADQADKDLVVDEMVNIPLAALVALADKGIRVVVCRNSVTEIREDLRGVRPRNWPEGSTWDTVPGLNDPSNNRVIIATRNGRIPPAGDGHGAHNLVLHEVAHAIGDAVTEGGVADPDFIAARDADRAQLDDYEGAAGRAGVRETYAESFARFYGNDPNDAATYPHLHAYWASNPIVAEAE